MGFIPSWVGDTRASSSLKLPREKGYLLKATRLRQTANVILYHVTKFSPYLSFTVHYDWTKSGRDTPVLSIRIVLSCFYLLFSYFENFST